MVTQGRFAERVAAHRGLTVQARMGFSQPEMMRVGLRAVRDSGVDTVGTITLDSFTRTGDLRRAREALMRGTSLNGFPLVAYGGRRTRDLLAEFDQQTFPVQLRHGSALPSRIFTQMLAAGITATEGGPVSYCLPYGRTPLRDAVADWSRACELLGAYDGDDGPVHLETFGGCMLGQLCPPGLLVALAILEAMFFIEHGVRSVSLSYAQQSCWGQDVGAVWALRRLARERLGDAAWHIVIYTWMGVYPRSRSGAMALLGESARLAAATGSERLIVKTASEAVRIPTIAENVAALRHATAAAETVSPAQVDTADGHDIYEEACTLVDAVLEQHRRLGPALIGAFRRGLLDVPYCLHPDNAQRARAVIDDTGRLHWASTGAMPIRPAGGTGRTPVTADRLLFMLQHKQRRNDHNSDALNHQSKGFTR